MNPHHHHHHAPHGRGHHRAALHHGDGHGGHYGGHRAHHPEHDGLPEFGPGFGPPHHGGRHGGAPGGRARRGEARYLLLDVLRGGQKHGYEIIKALEERSGGQYVPSPGTVYPTLQFLEDAGMIRAEQQSDRKVYTLTEVGQTELAARAAEIADFWTRQTGPTPSPASQTEMRFFREEIEGLMRTARGGIHEALLRDEPQTIRRIREAIEQCRSEVRRILSDTHAQTAEVKSETKKEANTAA